MKRSVKWGAFIAEMTTVETKQWQSVVQKMKWAYKRKAKEPPRDLLGWFKFLPEREEWDEVRKEITRRRRRAVERKKYPTKSVRDALEAQRRHYMREYMRKYRQNAKPQTAGATRSIG